MMTSKPKTFIIRLPVALLLMSSGCAAFFLLIVVIATSGIEQQRSEISVADVFSIRERNAVEELPPLEYVRYGRRGKSVLIFGYIPHPIVEEWVKKKRLFTSSTVMTKSQIQEVFEDADIGLSEIPSGVIEDNISISGEYRRGFFVAAYNQETGGFIMSAINVQ